MEGWSPRKVSTHPGGYNMSQGKTWLNKNPHAVPRGTWNGAGTLTTAVTKYGDSQSQADNSIVTLGRVWRNGKEQQEHIWVEFGAQLYLRPSALTLQAHLGYSDLRASEVPSVCLYPDTGPAACWVVPVSCL